MSLEERVALHDQWLRSTESNLERITENVAELSERQTRTEANVNKLVELQAVVLERMGAAHEAQARKHQELEDEMRRLSEEVRAFIRALRDGRSQQN